MGAIGSLISHTSVSTKHSLTPFFNVCLTKGLIQEGSIKNLQMYKCSFQNACCSALELNRECKSTLMFLVKNIQVGRSFPAYKNRNHYLFIYFILFFMHACLKQQSDKSW